MNGSDTATTVTWNLSPGNCLIHICNRFVEMLALLLYTVTSCNQQTLTSVSTQVGSFSGESTSDCSIFHGAYHDYILYIEEKPRPEPFFPSCSNRLNEDLICNKTRSRCYLLDPCENGETCSDERNNQHGYVCSCPADSSPLNCDSQHGPCSVNPCWHAGMRVFLIRPIRQSLSTSSLYSQFHAKTHPIEPSTAPVKLDGTVTGARRKLIIVPAIPARTKDSVKRCLATTNVIVWLAVILVVIVKTQMRSSSSDKWCPNHSVTSPSSLSLWLSCSWWSWIFKPVIERFIYVHGPSTVLPTSNRPETMV